VGLSALGAVTFPQLLLADGQVAVATAELLPLVLEKHKFLMSARCHGQEDTGLRFETQLRERVVNSLLLTESEGARGEGLFWCGSQYCECVAEAAEGEGKQGSIKQGSLFIEWRWIVNDKELTPLFSNINCFFLDIQV